MKKPRLLAGKAAFALMIFGSVAAAALLWLAAHVCGRIGAAPGGGFVRQCAGLPFFDGSRGVFLNAQPVTLSRRKVVRSARLMRFLVQKPQVPAGVTPALPVAGKDFSAVPSQKLVLLWLGHSFTLIEWHGCRFAVDPVFGNAAPLPGIVPRAVGCPLGRHDLPSLDFVLLTHDHYDHLEFDTIRFLRDTPTRFVVPLGVSARLEGWGIPRSRIIELDWRKSCTVGPFRVYCRMARHFSGRSLWDRDRTLWCSYAVEAAGERIFIAGDSGYGSHFAEIGRELGPFRLALLETDAWNENWPDNHMFPARFWQAAEELNAERVMPVHWGVFDLARHPWSESIGLVVDEAEKRGCLARCVVPRMGQRWSYDNPPALECWWKQIVQ